MGTTCGYCGNTLNDGAKFCPYCGAPVEPVAKKYGNTFRTGQINPGTESSISEQPNNEFAEIPVYEPDTDFKSMFMRHDNRLNRQRFILRSLGMFFVGIVIMRPLLSVAELVQSTFFQLLTMMVSMAFTIPSFMLIIRRLHDLNRPGWWCIGAMLPGINIVFAIYLVLFVGTNGPNQYGPDPLYEPE